MTSNEIIEECKLKFPIGTIFISRSQRNEIEIKNHNFEHNKYDGVDEVRYKDPLNKYNYLIYQKGKFAETKPILNINNHKDQIFDLDTPIWQLTVRQFLELTGHSKPTEVVVKSSQEKNLVYGLAGLKELLGCSHPTAQRIKDSGKIPFTQIGRKIIFDADAVLTALNKKK